MKRRGSIDNHTKIENSKNQDFEIPDINPSEFECDFEFITQPKDSTKKPFLDVINIEKEPLNLDDALKEM